jgi:hypothetical protein
VAVCAILCGCTQYDVGRLAGDATAGRDTGSPGSALAQQFLIGELKRISTRVLSRAVLARVAVPASR